jgi:hypothetical protein
MTASTAPRPAPRNGNGTRSKEQRGITVAPPTRLHRRVGLALTSALVGTLSVALGSAQGAAATPQPGRTFVVAPHGQGTVCSYRFPCSLETGQQLVRQRTAGMRGDLTVELLGGTYRLGKPLTLSSGTNDSGENGHTVVYRAAPGARPVLSGARRVTGWQRVDGSATWKAFVGAGTRSRQLYVDGVRQTRARTPGGLPGTVTQTSTGYVTTDPSPLSWSDPTGVELVYRTVYEEQRCPVASVTPSGTGAAITMAQPCFGWATDPNRWGGAGTTVKLPTWLENAPQFLGATGQWYLAPSGWLFYRPVPGQNLRTADVELPVLEQIMTATGTPAEPLHDVRFTGITFAYGTWLQPSTPVGFSEIQANTTWNGVIPQVSPANVTVSGAADVTFSGDTFTHLGAAGISVLGGSRNVKITRSLIEDVSGNGVVFGDWTNANPDPAQQNVGNSFSDNVVRTAGAEYHAAVGFFGGYLRDFTLSHNEFVDLPYTAVSLATIPANGSYAGNNLVEGNRIHRFLQVMSDGGGVYTIGDSPGTRIVGNYIYDDPGPYGAIYLDTKSANMTVERNVVANVDTNWLMLQTNKYYPGAAYNNTVRYNYADNDSINITGGAFNGPIDPSNTITDNATGLTEFPAAARRIMSQSGPRTAG